MCGFCGFLLSNSKNQYLNTNLNLLNEMSASIQHRGPDGHGQWYNKDKGIF